jgi:molybdate transport system regulatory protein
MDTLSVEDVAALLRLNKKRVQTLARAGKLPASRVGRKWLFSRARIEALLGSPSESAPAAVHDLSATEPASRSDSLAQVDGVMAEVRLAIGDQELVSIITRSSVERMGLKVGDQVFAVIKSTEVMIGK